MEQVNKRLSFLLQEGKAYLLSCTQDELVLKTRPERWSKLEILGHLIDSGLNNLKRFTEIQYFEKPYVVVSYNQDELVKANNYQHADLAELLPFWLAINNRILEILKLQTNDSLSYAVKLDQGMITDLNFLMKDYVDHMEHHLKQIMSD